MTPPDTQDLHAQIEQARQQLHAGNRAAAGAIVGEIAAVAGDEPMLRLKLAQLCGQLDERDSALDHLQRIMDSQSKDVDILLATARCLGDLNRHKQAIAVVRQVLDLNPAHVDAHSTLGTLLTESGDHGAALEHFQTMIARGIKLRLAYTNLARLRKFTPDDKAVIEQAKAAIASDIPAREKLAVHFALGKIYDDCQQFDQAFSHFQQANLLQKEEAEKEQAAWTGDADLNWFEQIKTVFSATNIARLSESGNHSATPVFIVGMPRTGTTLMERIIASHSRGAGAGELLAMPQIAHEVMREKENKAEVRALGRLVPENMAAFAERYLQTLRQDHNDALRIVDKLPGNYQNLGLIYCLFPKATIIHAVRHPLDTCLSCYFQAFAEVRWSNELESVAATYKLYRDYMSYWKKVLPKGKILDMQYESLVDSPVAESKRMLEHCGLSWEEQSLEYHQQQAVVRTVSHAQVRQPIYQSSKMRWANYGSHLQGLVNALSDYLLDDNAALAEHELRLPKKKRFGLF